MTSSIVRPQPERDLDSRLERRRALESQRHYRASRSRHDSKILNHDRIIGPVLGAALRCTGLYARGKQNALDVTVRRLRLSLPGLPASFDGFRILHLSDLHIDGVDGLAEVLAERVRDVEADVCAMTGDYRFDVEGSCSEVYPRMRTVIDAIRCEHGVMAILGNHDCADIAPELQRMGVAMLVNEGLPITRDGAALWIGGVDDPHHFACDDLQAAFAEAPDGAFRILLVHTPELYREAEAAGTRLYLCGHTHAGQIALPWIGAPIRNADCPKTYTAGLWRHGRMQGYTSAGAGCSMLPVRYNCPPEIAVVELRAGD